MLTTKFDKLGNVDTTLGRLAASRWVNEKLYAGKMLMIFSSRVATVIASPIHVYATQQDATQDFRASSEQFSQLEKGSREQSSASCLPISREELDVSGDRMIENFQRPEGTKVVITWERVR